MKVLGLTALVLLAFYWLHWSPRWEQLKQLERQSEAFRDQALSYEEAFEAFPTLKAEVARRKAAFVKRWGKPDPTGLKELNSIGHARVVLSVRTLESEDGPGLKVQVDGTAPAVTGWMLAVVRHPRGFAVSTAELSDKGGRLRGEIEIRAALAP